MTIFIFSLTIPFKSHTILMSMKSEMLIFDIPDTIFSYLFRYVIEKKEKLATRWVKAGKTAGPDCNFRVTDVIEGMDVQFQVRAENEAGCGHPSEPTDLIHIEDPTSK